MGGTTRKGETGFIFGRGRDLGRDLPQTKSVIDSPPGLQSLGAVYSVKQRNTE